MTGAKGVVITVGNEAVALCIRRDSVTRRSIERRSFTSGEAGAAGFWI